MTLIPVKYKRIHANFTRNILITSIKKATSGREGGREGEKNASRKEKRGGGWWLKQACRPTHETLTVLTVDRIVGGERREAPFWRNGEIRKGDKRKEERKAPPPYPRPLYLAGRSVPNWSHFVSRHTIRAAAMCSRREISALMLRPRGKQPSF